MATGTVTGKGRSLYIQAPAHPSQPFVSQLKTQDSGRFRASLNNNAGLGLGLGLYGHHKSTTKSWLVGIWGQHVRCK